MYTFDVVPPTLIIMDPHKWSCIHWVVTKESGNRTLVATQQVMKATRLSPFIAPMNLELSCHRRCLGQFNLLGPTCFMICRLCVGMNSIVKIWEGGPLHSNKIWEDSNGRKVEVLKFGQLLKILFSKFGRHDGWGSSIEIEKLYISRIQVHGNSSIQIWSSYAYSRSGQCSLTWWRVSLTISLDANCGTCLVWECFPYYWRRLLLQHATLTCMDFFFFLQVLHNNTWRQGDAPLMPRILQARLPTYLGPPSQNE